MALAGGIALTVPFNSGIVYNEGGMYSPDGSTRTFDANGKGTSFSDGVGIIVLKRLDDAIRDKDHIYATIKGAALNNDGSDKASFTAPSVRGQAEVIAMAHADAGVTPDQITYVETHGTATPLGDPIEVEALTLAFASTNAVGRTMARLLTHRSSIARSVRSRSTSATLTAAAGAAGVMKTALALQRGTIPANIGFETPNPSIDFANSPFRVAKENITWPRTDVPRIAGVSSFGVGGTNAHVILAEPPVEVPSSASRSKQLFLLSAKSKTSLDAMTENLRAWLGSHPEASLADAAYTLQVGRRSLQASPPDRGWIACRSDRCDREQGHQPARHARVARSRTRRGLHVPRTGFAVREHGPRPARQRAGLRPTFRSVLYALQQGTER